MNYHKRLGDVLLEAGILAPDQIKQALIIQARTKERLGSILINLGYTSAEIITEAIEVQLGIPQIDLNSVRLEPAVMALIPADMARQYQVVPIRTESDRLIVAMVDPTNYSVRDAIRNLTGYYVEPVIVTARQFWEKIRELPEPAERMAKVQEVADPGPQMALLHSLLQDAAARRISRIYIEPQTDVVNIRLCSDSKGNETVTFSFAMYHEILSRLKAML